MGAAEGAGRACWAQLRKVMCVRRSRAGFSVGFYKAAMCSDLCFIQLNPATRESDYRRGWGKGASLKRITRVWTRVTRQCANETKTLTGRQRQEEMQH